MRRQERAVSPPFLTAFVFSPPFIGILNHRKPVASWFTSAFARDRQTLTEKQPFSVQ